MKRFSYLAWIGLAVALVLYLQRKPSVETISCGFAVAGQQAILPEIQSGLTFVGPIEAADASKKLDLRSSMGVLKWSNSEKYLTSAGSAAFFTDRSGAVSGMFIYTWDSPRGFRSFSIATLGAEGWLGEDRRRVFVSRNAAEKQLYPASYKCKISE